MLAHSFAYWLVKRSNSFGWLAQWREFCVTNFLLNEFCATKRRSIEHIQSRSRVASLLDFKQEQPSSAATWKMDAIHFTRKIMQITKVWFIFAFMPDLFLSLVTIGTHCKKKWGKERHRERKKNALWSINQSLRRIFNANVCRNVNLSCWLSLKIIENGIMNCHFFNLIGRFNWKCNEMPATLWAFILFLRLACYLNAINQSIFTFSLLVWKPKRHKLIAGGRGGRKGEKFVCVWLSHTKALCTKI